MSTISVTTVFVVIWSSTAAAGAPLTFTYQGRLTNGSGTAIAETTVTLKFRILNTAGDCIIYSETQTVNTATSGGMFSVELGSALADSKRTTEDRGNTMDAVFSNNGTAIPGKQLASPAANCASDYTPTTTDDRKLQIVVLATTSQPALNLELSPMQRITTVPYATVAQTLNGYSSSQFLRLTGAAAAPTARVTAGNINTVMDRLFTTQATGYDRLDDILTNWGSNISISSNNFNVNSNKITNLATPTAGTDAANKNYCDGYVGGQATSGLGALGAGDNGKALVWNGTNWVAQTQNSLPAQATHGGKYLTTDGTSASWATISALPTQTGNNGKFLTTDGTSASWNTLFSNGTALNDGYVYTISNGNQPAFVNPASIYILKGGQAGALSLGTSDATDLTLLTNNTAKLTVKSDGNVGIGTTSPSASLTVAGIIQSTTGGIKFPDGTVQTTTSTTCNPLMAVGYMPAMAAATGVTADGIVTVSASSQFNSSFQGFNAFGSGEWATAGVVTNFWLRIDLPVAKTVTSIYAAGRAGSEYPATWIFQGSNDGTTWTDLITSSTPLLPGGVSVSVPSPASFTSYRLYANTSVGPNPGLDVFQIYTAASSCAPWGSQGNSGTTPATSYIGTNDAQAFVTKTNATERMRILSTGEVGIGTSTPSSKLHVSGGAIVAAPQTSSTQCINFSTGNINVSSYNGTNTIQIGGLVDGGAYSLVLTGYTAGQTVTVNAFTDAGCSTTAVTHGVDFGGSTSAVTSTFIANGNTQFLTFIYSAARGVVYASATTNFYR